MARDLIAKEDKGSGRMKLADFYQAGWQFRESKEYLKQLGAIDDFQGKMPRVIIPNYINSVTNCIATSAMYSICCIDPCEELLGHLERRVAKPEASPEELVNMVAALPSTTVKAPRHLSVTLVKHLNEIAEGHGGRVPLHGRLFAQWLHHAYPRECPFPAVAGTTKPLTADDWLRETNTTNTLSDADIDAVVNDEFALLQDQLKVKDLVDGDAEETLPWLAHEELFAHHRRPSMAHELRVVMRGVVCVTAFFVFAFALVKMALGVAGTAWPRLGSKAIV